MDEEALAALMKGVDEHTAAAERQFSEGASTGASQRRVRTRSSAPARRRAAGPEQESSVGDEVQITDMVCYFLCGVYIILAAGLLLRGCSLTAPLATLCRDASALN